MSSWTVLHVEDIIIFFPLAILPSVVFILGYTWLFCIQLTSDKIRNKDLSFSGSVI